MILGGIIAGDFGGELYRCFHSSVLAVKSSDNVVWERFKKSVANLKVRIVFSGQTNWPFFIWQDRNRFYFSNRHIPFTDYHCFSTAYFFHETREMCFYFIYVQVYHDHILSHNVGHVKHILAKAPNYKLQITNKHQITMTKIPNIGDQGDDFCSKNWKLFGI